MILTKSDYIAGLSCPHCLWQSVHSEEKTTPPDPCALFIMDQGTRVGKLATRLYPDGIRGNDTSLDRPLFEADFRADVLLSKADILVPGWDIVEVKSSTHVKEEHLHDLSFQRHCYARAGLDIRRCFLLHINRNYVRRGDLDLKKLFNRKDVTLEVDEISEGISERICSIRKMLDSPCPPPTLGCCLDLPRDSILDLHRIGSKAQKFYDEGFRMIADVPDSMLSEKQKIQKRCIQKGDVHIDKKRLSGFLASLKEPLQFLDFETFGVAIPPFEGIRPYQQIPFQFSLHSSSHHEFLAHGGDPREAFLRDLKSSLDPEGSIVVYNKAFEIARLKELAEDFPVHKGWISSLYPRFVDLLVPFRNFWYYHPDQRGSVSIKSVLPAVTGKSYEGSIDNGQLAMVRYLGLEKDPDKEKTREDLLSYCGLDTEGMRWIVDKLKELV